LLVRLLHLLQADCSLSRLLPLPLPASAPALDLQQPAAACGAQQPQPWQPQQLMLLLLLSRRPCCGVPLLLRPRLGAAAISQDVTAFSQLQQLTVSVAAPD
jgi:hypothetical protein